MARPSETVLAIGLSRKTCFPAAAAAEVVARCTSFGVVLMIASIFGSASIASKLATGRRGILPRIFDVFPPNGCSSRESRACPSAGWRRPEHPTTIPSRCSPRAADQHSRLSPSCGPRSQCVVSSRTTPTRLLPGALTGEALALGDMHLGFPPGFLPRVRLCEGEADCAPACHRHQAVFILMRPTPKYCRFGNRRQIVRGNLCVRSGTPMRGRGIAHGWIERRVDTIGFARVLNESSLRTQGSITPGLKSKKASAPVPKRDSSPYGSLRSRLCEKWVC